MDLKQLQTIMARLYTDAEVRARFIDDPESVATTFELSPTEADYLAAVSAEEVRRFAQSLHRKRADEVRGLLPLTCRALADRFGPLFDAHAEQFLPGGIRKHEDDAIAFARFLSRNEYNDSVSLALLDLARFETAHLIARQSRVCVVVRLFHHDMRRLIRQLEKGGSIAPAVSRRTAAVWFRFGSNTRVFCFAWPLRMGEWSRQREVNLMSEAD